MRGRINKEKEGLTVRFSVRLPKDQHEWLKEKSMETKGKNFVSMNDYISKAIDLLKEEYY